MLGLPLPAISECNKLISVLYYSQSLLSTYSATANMSSSNKTPTKAKVLLTGLRVEADVPDYFRELYGTPSEIMAKIDADAQRIRDAGYDVTQYFMDDKDPHKGLDWLAEKLKSESFNGILVGSGLRLIPPQTELFEKVMDVCRRESPRRVMG